MWAQLKTDELRPGDVRPLDVYFLGHATAPRVGTLVVTHDPMTNLNLPSFYSFYFCDYCCDLSITERLTTHIEEACVRSRE